MKRRLNKKHAEKLVSLVSKARAADLEWQEACESVGLEEQLYAEMQRRKNRLSQQASEARKALLDFILPERK